jgi:hypothetical protein
MAERVGKVPDEEEAEGGTHGATEEDEGGCVGDEDEDDGRGEGDEGGAVEEVWREVGGGKHGCGRWRWVKKLAMVVERRQELSI